MAIQYDTRIARSSPDSGSFSSSGAQQDELSASLTIDYIIDFYDDTDPTFDGKHLDSMYVLTNSGLPIVNASVFYNPETGLLSPYVVCRGKTVRRDPARSTRWFAQTQWSSGNQNNATTENDLSGQPPADSLTNIAPQFEYSLRERERRVYSSQDASAKPFFTPTGNDWSEPLYTRESDIEVVVRHYQSFISYEDLQSRRFKVNQDTFAGKDPFTWIIEDCSATEVTVQLQTGPTLAALVVHRLIWTAREEGWKDRRALVDTHYFDEFDDDQKKAFTDDEFATQTTGNVDVDGYRIISTEFQDWITQDSIDFAPLIPEPPTMQSWGSNG